MTHEKAVLVLEDGTRFTGRAYGARGETIGEAVFSTGMSGYQETLTDPSYAGQIVVQTAPHIGNTGMNPDDPESRRIWVAGYVVRDPSRVVSNHRATRSLDDDLERDGIVGISGIDTRALTRRIREVGAMRAGIFSGELAELDAADQLARVTAAPEMTGQNLSAQVSVETGEVVPAEGERIGTLAIIDLGIKSATVRALAERVEPKTPMFVSLRSTAGTELRNHPHERIRHFSQHTADVNSCSRQGFSGLLVDHNALDHGLRFEGEIQLHALLVRPLDLL